MAKKRMLSIDVIESDEFCSLPASAQCLYLHLCMNADDDGFVDKWKSILRYLGVRRAMLERLIDAGYLIEMPREVLLVSDWRRHNVVRMDRYSEGSHKALLDTLDRQPNGRYIKAFGRFLATQDK